MPEKPAEIGIAYVSTDGTLKNIALYILCGLLNYAAMPNP
jgi:hypothetical protein